MVRAASAGSPHPLRASAKRSKLYHTGALIERLGAVVAANHTEDPDGEPVELVLRLVDDVVEVSIDACGEPLHKRGYRAHPGKAPLREDLARALLLHAGWPAQVSLHDPMCGSGTIAIEGALLAGGVAPGLHRHFTAERLPFFPPAPLARERERAAEEAEARRSRSFRVSASDADPRAVELTKRHARLAGVEVDVRVAALAESVLEAELLATNPPWGVGSPGDPAQPPTTATSSRPRPARARRRHGRSRS
ncbi:MAG: hypothetical protein HC923_01930 [Myxococcales bacterium]|nr:hypothetical protein [Myxococcales bacterium]